MNNYKLYEKYLEATSVCTDSRKCEKGSIFFALKGENFNGNKYAQKAIDMGCAYAVVDEKYYDDIYADRIFLVDNVLKELQDMARHHRQQMPAKIIGITGTNGKTTTKELMAAVLAQKEEILFTEGNLNNQIGVPLTLLRLRRGHTIAIIEMGASHLGDIKELVDIALPDYGVITNIGKAHLGGFGSLEGVRRTKGELFDFLRQSALSKAFINVDDDVLIDLSKGIEVITYGKDNKANIEGRVVENSPFLSVEYRQNKDSWNKVSTNLIGDYNFYNILAAVTVGKYFSVPDRLIKAALENYQPTNSRSQLKRTDKNVLIIDAYNANPTSMQAAIRNFANMDCSNKMLILGDMRELGEDSLKEHRSIIELLEKLMFTNVVLVGEEFMKVNDKHIFSSYENVTQLMESTAFMSLSDMTILIKGSNGIKLSSLVDYL